MRRNRHKLKSGDRVSFTAKTVVEGYLGFLGFDPLLYPAFELWDQEIKTYVRGCRAVGLQGRKMCVQVPSVVHRQELYYHKDRVLKRINQSFGRKVIEDIQVEFEKGGHN